MLLIRNIEVIEVANDFIEIYEKKFRPSAPISKSPVLMTIYREIVYGRRFVNERGGEVCIGSSKKVEDTIGLCFGVFEKMGKTIDNQSHKIRLQSSLIEKYKTMTFFQRLKFLFKGDKL